ncbi:uncharacterized protein LOC135838405 [Planococcus citri]|uniref:uncharacterized protein LOC135838405 n=1 Tax=Planococcus citri TaxID=170843 RepID=UPI0031F9987A
MNPPVEETENNIENKTENNNTEDNSTPSTSSPQLNISTQTSDSDSELLDNSFREFVPSNSPTPLPKLDKTSTGWLSNLLLTEAKFIAKILTLEVPPKSNIEKIRNCIRTYCSQSTKHNIYAKQIYANLIKYQTTKTSNKKIQTDMANKDKIFHPDKFSGFDDDLYKFLENFDLCSTANGWGDEDKAKYFPMLLTDLALEVFQNISDRKTKFSELKPQFLTAFNEKAHKDLNQSKLFTRFQKENEKTLQYLTEILNLCKSINENMPEEDKCKHILRGLNPTILKAISLSDNDTVEKIRKNIQKYECSKNLLDYRKNFDQGDRLKKVENELCALKNNNNTVEKISQSLSQLNIQPEPLMRRPNFLPFRPRSRPIYPFNPQNQTPFQYQIRTPRPYNFPPIIQRPFTPRPLPPRSFPFRPFPLRPLPSRPFFSSNRQQLSQVPRYPFNRPNFQQNYNPSQNQNRNQNSNLFCTNCRKSGHKKENCRNQKKNANK